MSTKPLTLIHGAQRSASSPTLGEKFSPGPDPRAALRNMRLEEALIEQLQPFLETYRLRCEPEATSRDLFAPVERTFTRVFDDEHDVALLQIPKWIAKDASTIGALDEVRTAFRGRIVRILSRGVDQATFGLERIFEYWQANEAIDGRFVAWNRINELGEYPFHEIFRLEMEPLEPDRAPDARPQPVPDLPPEEPEVVEIVRDQIFISYSRADESWRERLQIQLAPVVAADQLDVWTDERIDPGDLWLEKIREALTRAKVAVLLVSPTFLASDFIGREELPAIFEAARADGVRILWIHISDSRWDRTPIAAYQAAHRPPEPLDGLKKADRNRVLNQITRAIEKAMAGEPEDDGGDDDGDRGNGDGD